MVLANIHMQLWRKTSKTAQGLHQTANSGYFWGELFEFQQECIPLLFVGGK